jgi:uncharacterized glyoxalase superfamily protein PhnB
MGQPSFMGVHLAVADMRATVAFYRLAGLTIEEGVEDQPHVEITFDSGAHVALSAKPVIDMYDPGWRGPEPSTAAVLQFGLASRDAVDEVYRRLTDAGYHGHLPPIDAFWRSRYCEVDDPDGHAVGFHSPRDAPPVT